MACKKRGVPSFCGPCRRADGFQHLIDENRLRTEEVGGETCVYAEYLYQAEVGVAKRLMVLRDRVNQLWQVDYQRSSKRGKR